MESRKECLSSFKNVRRENEELIEYRRTHEHLNIPEPAKKTAAEGKQRGENSRDGDGEFDEADQTHDSDDQEHEFYRRVSRIRSEYLII